MKLAITGGSGGVGRAVIDLALSEGHTVVSLDRVALADPPSGVTAVQADLADYDSLLAAFRGCDAVIHLAAIPSPGEHPDHEVHNNNVVGSYNALRAAAEAGIRRVCQASSVNAIGLAYSRWPRFDYFPLDEAHPTYNEDPYSLSKWLCEQQADAFVRRYDMTIASLRFHWVVENREFAREHTRHYDGVPEFKRALWGYVRRDATARACLLGVTAPFAGHEALFIVAPDLAVDEPALSLRERYFPDVPIRGDLSGNRSFFDCSNAERVLGWRHDAS